MEVARFGIVIDGFSFRYFVEFVSGHIILGFRKAKVAAGALVELIVVVLLGSGSLFDEFLVAEDDELHLRISSHGWALVDVMMKCVLIIT